VSKNDASPTKLSPIEPQLNPQTLTKNCLPPRKRTKQETTNPKNKLEWELHTSF